MFALQSDVAAAIVEPIRAETVSAESVPRKVLASPNPHALEAYLQGVYYRGQMGSGAGYEGYKDALKFFQQAISEDQKFRASLFETGRDLRCCVRLAAERDPGSCGYEGETSSYSGRPGCNPTNTLNGLWVSHWPAYRSFHSHGFRHLVVSGRP